MQSIRDLPDITTRQIEHLFAHYNDLEPGTGVRIVGWAGPEEVKTEIIGYAARFVAAGH